MFLIKGHLNLKNSSVEPTSFKLAVEQRSRLTVIIALLQTGQGGSFGRGEASFFLHSHLFSVLTARTHVLQTAEGRWSLVSSGGGGSVTASS